MGRNLEADRARSRAYYQANRERILARHRLRVLAIREQVLAQQREYYRANRGRAYGISSIRFAEMWHEQNGRCANLKCGSELEHGAHFDHDHRCCPGKKACGSCVRGLLCPSCNTALGHIADDVERLAGLIEYLESHPLRPKNQEQLRMVG